MGIGASKPEAVDTGAPSSPFSGCWPRYTLPSDYLKVAVEGCNLRREAVEEQIWWHLAGLQCKRGLQQTSQPSRSLCVSDYCLDRSDIELTIPERMTSRKERRAHSLGFEWIALFIIKATLARRFHNMSMKASEPKMGRNSLPAK